MTCYDPTEEFGGCGCDHKDSNGNKPDHIVDSDMGGPWSMQDRSVHDDSVPDDRVQALVDDARGASGQELWNHFFDHADQWGADGYSRGATYWALSDVKDELGLGAEPDLVQVLNDGHAWGYSD